jgi:hypothetical protein
MNLGLRDPAWLTYAVLPFATECPEVRSVSRFG